MERKATLGDDELLISTESVIDRREQSSMAEYKVKLRSLKQPCLQVVARRQGCSGPLYDYPPQPPPSVR